MKSVASGMSGNNGGSKPASARTALVASMGIAARHNYDMRDAFDGMGNHTGPLAVRKAMQSLRASGGDIGTTRHINTGFRLIVEGVRGGNGNSKGLSGPQLLH